MSCWLLHVLCLCYYQKRSGLTCADVAQILWSTENCFSESLGVFNDSQGGYKKYFKRNYIAKVFVIGCVSCNKFSHFRQKKSGVLLLRTRKVRVYGPVYYGAYPIPTHLSPPAPHARAPNKAQGSPPMGQCAPRRADGAADITPPHCEWGAGGGAARGCGAAACVHVHSMCTTKCGCARRRRRRRAAAEVGEVQSSEYTAQFSRFHPSSHSWEVYNRALKQQTGSAGHYKPCLKSSLPRGRLAAYMWRDFLAQTRRACLLGRRLLLVAAAGFFNWRWSYCPRGVAP